jgi:hypothetical protein
MIAQRLVQLIETHADQLARGLREKLERSERASDMRKVPADEIQIRVYEVYRNLSDWLLTRTESSIEQHYTAIGARRAAQGVSLSHLLYAILAVKEYLWEFLNHEAMVDRHVELLQEMELLRMVDQFFDRAVYYAAQGYERAHTARAA